MPRSFCIPGIVFLFCAFVLSFLVSISLPYLTALDVVRTHFDGTPFLGSVGLSEVRFGIWAPCTYDTQNSRTCASAHHGYSFTAFSLVDTNPDDKLFITIGSSWTRGLAVHPVATVATFIAFALSFSTHITITLAASLMSFFAALLTLIAFAIDIALYAYVHHKMGELPNVRQHTNTGPGFWLTFVSLILLLLGGCTVCFGRRKDRLSGSTPSYPMSTANNGFFSRFRKS
ncbi:actin cortical patch SUR7/pH-response regulator pali [Mycena floridula]|nr:actin cortical patch SUR7/pH-response regulator pali [Mycena floridula]